MDSGELLELLGNENRRRILRLLSHKPCYVTEISEHLGVSPKAVIDHLRKLESAGLIESTTDDKRRKYFRITRSLRLEVTVSPYAFGAKSAYPANPGLDMSGRCDHLSLDLGTDGDPSDLPELVEEFARLRGLDRELSLAQRWVHGRLTSILDELDGYLRTEADSGFYAEVLAAVSKTDGTPDAVADELGVSPGTAVEALAMLNDRGLLARRDGAYTLP